MIVVGTLADRLKIAREKKRLSQAELAEKVNTSQQAIAKIEKGITLQPRNITEIANALETSQKWLQLGIEEDEHLRSHTDVFRIDVLNISASAGPGVINSEFVEVLRSVEYSIDHARCMFNSRKPEQIRIINVSGDSMSGTIEPGDLLFVDISIRKFDGDGIYTFLYDETVHVKRLQKMKDKFIVISDNKNYPPWEPIEREEMNRVFIFGKVIASTPQTYRKHG